MEPLISVIVSVYNAEEHLEKCLDSTVNQSYRNLQIITIDDGSTDRSGKICEAWAEKDSRIEVIHQSNQGVGAARNTGLNCAVGEFICFVDADDWMNEEEVELLWEAITKTGAEIAVCGHIACNERSKPAQEKTEVYNAEVLSHIDTLKRYYGGTTYRMNAVWGKIFKKELFKNIRFPLTRIGEDVAVLYKLYDRTKNVVFIPAKLHSYYINPHSLTHKRYSERNLVGIDISRQQLEYFKDTMDFELLNKVRNQHILDLILIYCQLADSEVSNRREICKSLRGEFLEKYKNGFAYATRKQKVMSILFRINPYLLLFAVKFRNNIKGG